MNSQATIRECNETGMNHSPLPTILWSVHAGMYEDSQLQIESAVFGFGATLK